MHQCIHKEDHHKHDGRKLHQQVAQAAYASFKVRLWLGLF